MGPVKVLWDGNGVPQGVDRQTPVKTVPSRRTTYAGGKNAYQAQEILTFSRSQNYD